VTVGVNVMIAIFGDYDQPFLGKKQLYDSYVAEFRAHDAGVGYVGSLIQVREGKLLFSFSEAGF
jgi:hypothetical protein